MHLKKQDIADSGFTLIEMLVAVSTLIILGGISYTVFKTAIEAYTQTSTKILASQRSRTALDKIINDLQHIQVSTEEPEFALYTQDIPTESSDRDMFSFVTLVNTEPDPFLAQLNIENFGPQSTSENTLVSDVQRVGYFLGNEMQPGETAIPPMAQENPDSQTETLTLYRVTTTALEPELVIGRLLETGTAPEIDENGEPVYFQLAPLISGILNFDLKYFDGEETWYNSWDSTDSMPKAVQILITVKGKSDLPSRSQTQLNSQQGETVRQSDTMTQSTMVSLPSASSDSSEL